MTVRWEKRSAKGIQVRLVWETKGGREYEVERAVGFARHRLGRVNEFTDGWTATTLDNSEVGTFGSRAAAVRALAAEQS